MTSIKCRYTIPYCTYDFKHERVYHNELWWCDEPGICDGVYTKPDGAKTINPQCVHCEYKTGEFEKSVKKYSYEEGVLTVAGKTYYENEINYLEIDERIIINKED